MSNYCVLARDLHDSFYSMHLERRQDTSVETRLPPVAEADFEMESHSYACHQLKHSYGVATLKS